MAFLLLIPFFFVRFFLMHLLDPAAVSRAAHCPPMSKGEWVAYWICQLSNMAIFLNILRTNLYTTPLPVFRAGILVYLAGMTLLTFSVIHFSIPAGNGFRQTGVYRFSRNPMYVSYYVVFLGCALLNQSLLLLILVLIFQVSGHWLVLAEERWCLKQFGGPYRQYQKRVRRYL
ncbi:MAG: phospholipid methyltransferase [Oscillospiraceae bacterium]|nr:phospholipid methyltransferase [Oscillospiraceae bacterium]